MEFLEGIPSVRCGFPACCAAMKTCDGYPEGFNLIDHGDCRMKKVVSDLFIQASKDVEKMKAL